MKVAEFVPAATVTDAGTVRTVFVFVSVTTAPPVGAAPLKVTVQAVLLELLKVEAAHDRTVTVGKGTVPVTTPPVPDTLIPCPALEAAAVLLIAIGVLLTPAAGATFTTAKTPLEIVLAFMPDIRQEYVPEPAKQLNVLEAFVAAAPALAETVTRLLAGYVRVHSTAAGWLPDGNVKVRFRDAIPPVPTAPEARDRESTCPEAGYSDANMTIAITIIRATPAPLRCFHAICLCATVTD